MFVFGQWNLIFRENKNIIVQISVTTGFPTPVHIYLGTASSHIHIIFYLCSAHYMFVKFSSQLGTGI
jgi:hypothetical protein